MHGLKIYFHYMENPSAALKEWVQARSVARACAGYLAGALSWVLFFNIGDGLSVAAFAVKLFVVFAAEVAVGFMLAAVCGLFLDFIRVKSSPAEIFCLLGTAGLINGLLPAFALSSAVWPAAHLNLLAPLGMLLVAGLKLGYLSRGLMRVYPLSAAKAVGIWLLCLLPPAVAVSLLAAFGIWSLVLLF